MDICYRFTSARVLVTRCYTELPLWLPDIEGKPPVCCQTRTRGGGELMVDTSARSTTSRTATSTTGSQTQPVRRSGTRWGLGGGPFMVLRSRNARGSYGPLTSLRTLLASTVRAWRAPPRNRSVEATQPQVLWLVCSLKPHAEPERFRTAWERLRGRCVASTRDQNQPLKRYFTDLH